MFLLSTVGCGDDLDRAPEPGRYSYVARHPLPLTGDTITLSGVLEITEASPDEIVGRWDARRLHPELRGGYWEETAYEVFAAPSYGGTLRHRIVRVGGELRCDGEYDWVAADGVERTVPLSCALAPVAEAPAVPEIPGPKSPAVRPLEGDRVLPR